MKVKWAWLTLLALFLFFFIAASMIFLFGDRFASVEHPTPLGYLFFISTGVVITGLAVTLTIITAKSVARPEIEKVLAAG